MIAKPMPGRRVRHPETKTVLPEEGLHVPDHDPHWIRLQADDDVALASDPAPEEAGS